MVNLLFVLEGWYCHQQEHHRRDCQHKTIVKDADGVEFTAWSGEKGWADSGCKELDSGAVYLTATMAAAVVALAFRMELNSNNSIRRWSFSTYDTFHLRQHKMVQVKHIDKKLNKMENQGVANLFWKKSFLTRSTYSTSKNLVRDLSSSSVWTTKKPRKLPSSREGT